MRLGCRFQGPRGEAVGNSAQIATTNRTSASMGFHRKISVQALVWLAALLMPAQAVPAACSCGDHASKSAPVATAGGGAAPSCPHCRAKSAAHACCKGKAAAAHPGCCGGGANCRCCCGKSGSSSQGSGCHCVHNNSAPAPDSAPSPSPTNTAKSPLATPSFGSVTTVAMFALQAAFAAADQHPTLLASSAPERLSVLCRLVI